MTIKRFWQYYTPTCDYCGAQLQAAMSFEDAVKAKKAARWRSVKADGEWHDVCPDCQKTPQAPGPVPCKPGPPP